MQKGFNKIVGNEKYRRHFRETVASDKLLLLKFFQICIKLCLWCSFPNFHTNPSKHEKILTKHCIALLVWELVKALLELFGLLLTLIDRYSELVPRVLEILIKYFIKWTLFCFYDLTNVNKIYYPLAKLNIIDKSDQMQIIYKCNYLIENWFYVNKSIKLKINYSIIDT